MEKTVRRGIPLDGVALRGARERSPMTVRELAAVSGVSHNTITNLENGRRMARPSTTRKLARALGVEPGALMESEVGG